MNRNEEFEYFVDQLLDNVARSYKNSEQCILIQETLEKMDQELEKKLSQEDWELATEYFEYLLLADNKEEGYVYRQGIADCVFILKKLGVLS